MCVCVIETAVRKWVWPAGGLREDVVPVPVLNAPTHPVAKEVDSAVGDCGSQGGQHSSIEPTYALERVEGREGERSRCFSGGWG